MSIVSFCSSLPAGPHGFKHGRGTRDMVHMPCIVRRTARSPAQACRLLRWNKYHCAAVPTNSSLSPSPTPLDVEIELDLEPFLIKYKSGRIERLGRFGDRTDYVEASLDPATEVTSRDAITDTGVPVRIYLPKVDDSPPNSLRVLVYFHGGAFLVEDSASPPYHNYLNNLASKANILIVSVNYRLAPEYPLPVAYDDCMEALNWVNKHSDGTGQEDWINKHGDFDHLFISGDSAGGNITHNIAMSTDAPKNIEGIALVHPYFFGKVALETELQDPTNLLLHRKLWSFITPESEGLDDPRVNPLGPTAPSLEKIKCKRAVVFVAGEDFHSERGRKYSEKLKSEFKGEVPLLCNHDGVGHVYHLSVDATEEEIESAAAWKMMTDLLKFYKDNDVVLEGSIVESLKAKTTEGIKKMKEIEKGMSERMMEQLVAFYNGKPVPYSS
uniref:Tuliposide B-converting enzyme 1, amyloplastic n=1 Tax=Tulipa gesneriana TaxID=13306 RepID=TCEB1_TULGE|nr:RecName: Full=Tuliposide B-converting enzyme 1, amyloplastic; Short=TgTCEB1; Flags: Precursor [Tulipa gesneriana]BAR97239.1 tuliposide B-converting enzyme [Tulipa gesneriana]BAR97240.1 tuliposide B-converting enzyme [Tulipa gesneriana]